MRSGEGRGRARPVAAGRPRRLVKRALALVGGRRPARGATLLIYHRIGGGTSDELDLPLADFTAQMDVLADHDVVDLDTAMDRLDAGDTAPTVVLTFDDGFDDVYTRAWPVLRERGLPFTIYLASAYPGRPLQWEGSTATGAPGLGLTWAQLEELMASGLCTIGNHTHHHVQPERLTAAELDTCSAAIEERLGVRPRHFTYPWGIAVPALHEAMGQRFRTASTGELGRNLPGTDRLRLRRVPVRRTDPLAFFAAKLHGDLRPEACYAALVGAVKGVQGRIGRVRRAPRPA